MHILLQSAVSFISLVLQLGNHTNKNNTEPLAPFAKNIQLSNPFRPDLKLAIVKYII